jgi:hypothetical protein
MTGIPDRKLITQQEELPEWPITGPFGGVQSELPLTEIEPYGFYDSTNILFRQGKASVRPGFTALPAWPTAPFNEAALAFPGFFNSNGVDIQCAITPTRLFQWIPGTPGSWTQITGPALTGGTTQVWNWDILGYKLCFSQGTNQVLTWDGIAGTYVLSSANAPACNAMAEIDLHLMTGNTVEGGVAFPQRYRWSGAGDPTDWTSFNAGLNDNLNNLGPINGIIKLGQYGYGFHYQGVVQVIPTGVGTAPFYFLPIINSYIGEIALKSLDNFNREGQEQAILVASDNVYNFNQSSMVPIGDHPIDGHKRIGARSRIMADLKAGGLTNTWGFVTNAIAGEIFNAYWLIIPNVAVWVYNLDEENWTPFQYSKTPLVLDNFQRSNVLRIEDLSGSILQQFWSPATLAATLQMPGIAFGFSDGTVGYVDFTNRSEVGWQVVSAKHTFGDRRHSHVIKKFRLVVIDNGPVTYTITITNERGFSQSQTFTLGSGSGDVLSQVVEFNITGLRLQWKVSGPAGAPSDMIEFCPIYEITGEQRGGSADGN